MGLARDSLTIYKREMLIFKANIRANVIRSIMFPLVIILFLGNLGIGLTNTPVAVVNYANNLQASQFINALQSQQEIKIASITDQETALSQLKAGTVQIVVVILPTFPGKGPAPNMDIYYSNSQLTETQTAVPYIESIAAEFSGRIVANGQQLSLPSSPSGTVSSSALYAADSSYKDFLTGGVIAMVVIFGAMFGGGLSLLADKQLGNLKAFLITPINKDAIVIGKIMSGTTSAMLYAILALGIGMLDGVQVAMGVAALPFILLTAAIIGLGFSALTFVIAAKVTKTEIYAIISQAIGLPIWFISGGLEPVNSLPGWMQPLTVINPATYANDAARNVIMLGYFPLSSIVVDYSAMLLFAGIAIFLAFRSFKSTIE